MRDEGKRWELRGHGLYHLVDISHIEHAFFSANNFFQQLAPISENQKIFMKMINDHRSEFLILSNWNKET